ncbi:sensor histidine kinase [Psychrobacter immobilis]|uniref:sensor histidine kinase n=1 Tax=Psychrobacter immobilis TaxID=498 RepID=UPI00191A70FE|nr:sensor histidine kinase [Psychrobacter immobilis]
MTELTYNIRPSARLIKTIGEDLIGDPNSALIELVKNSYDADASKVEIIFEYKEISNENVLSIKVIDDGHGMDSDTVINKWLVPATDDKLKKKISRSTKRVLQGRKGIGRFASAILGQELTLSSTVKDEQTVIFIDWDRFSAEKYLSDIKLLIDVNSGKYSSGTTIEILAFNREEELKKSYWSPERFNKLINELRKLLNPFDSFEKDRFGISLEVINAPYEFNSGKIDVERYPIIDFYDYRIFGIVNENGEASLTYENAVEIDAKQVHSFSKNITLNENESFCGKVELDLRVFDRELEAFNNLIDKGLVDPISKEKIGKQEARRELNSVYGVNIYKNKFRISPYGNTGVDWLKLDNKRIQNPSLRIGNNQIVGFIVIQSEELSGLEEKSARDGLKENRQLEGLKHIIDEVIKELELRRFSFRKKSKRGRAKENTIDFKINDLFDFADIKRIIQDSASKEMNEEKISEILGFISKKEESKTKMLEEIRRQIAVYQGQATLGRIVNVVLHEGRKPLQFFQMEARNLVKSYELFDQTKNQEFLEDFEEILDGFKKNANSLSALFKRITPLANQRRSNRKDFLVEESILDSFKVFEAQLEISNIMYDVNISDKRQIHGWREDLSIAFANLIENSIYWLDKTDTELKEIIIKDEVHADGSYSIIYTDNGPGIKGDDIETGDIFEPGYTTKDTKDATGLGLSIAGEAIDRLGGTLSAVESSKGVCFEFKFKAIENDANS